jgi:nucleoredoxin
VPSGERSVCHGHRSPPQQERAPQKSPAISSVTFFTNNENFFSSIPKMKKLLPLLLLLPLTTFASLEELIGPELVDADGDKVETSSLQGKVIGLYFSASWCGPCRAFTPSLVKLRDRKDDEFEVVFVSSDRSAEDQMEYMEDYDMDWPAIPYDSPLRQELGAKYGVRGIPSLVIVDDQGNLITKNGRSEMSGSDANARKALREWRRAAGQESDDSDDD